MPVQFGPAGYGADFAPLAQVAANLALREQIPQAAPQGGFGTSVSGAQSAMRGINNQAAVATMRSGQSVGQAVAGEELAGERLLESQAFKEMLAARKRKREKEGFDASLAQRREEVESMKDSARRNQGIATAGAALRLGSGLAGRYFGSLDTPPPLPEP